jgi:hypothetical protein
LLESGQGAENFGLDPQLLFRASTRLTIFAAIRRAASLLIGFATNASVCTGAVNAAQTHPTLVYAVFAGGLYSDGLIVPFASASAKRHQTHRRFDAICRAVRWQEIKSLK